MPSVSGDVSDDVPEPQEIADEQISAANVSEIKRNFFMTDSTAFADAKASFLYLEFFVENILLSERLSDFFKNLNRRDGYPPKSVRSDVQEIIDAAFVQMLFGFQD